MRNLLPLLAAGLLFSCATETVVNKAPGEEAPAVEEAPAEEAETFGDPLSSNVGSVGLGEMIASPVAYAGKKVELVGVVRAVCQKRGCWMEIRPEETLEGTALHVKFKNYGFFMPKDARGATVRVQGSVAVSTLTAAQVAELEAEGATFTDKKADGSVEQALFTATGVEMTGRKK